MISKSEPPASRIAFTRSYARFRVCGDREPLILQEMSGLGWRAYVPSGFTHIGSTLIAVYPCAIAFSVAFA